jgi:hypothetical protein
MLRFVNAVLGLLRQDDALGKFARNAGPTAFPSSHQDVIKSLAALHLGLAATGIHCRLFRSVGLSEDGSGGEASPTSRFFAPTACRIALRA